MQLEGCFDYLIVGSGLFGATYVHLATKVGKRCLVIDKRPHLGGNDVELYEPLAGMEPYYPVNDERNNTLVDAYRALASKETDVIFGDRLAEDKYYDMAPVMEKVLKYDF